MMMRHTRNWKISLEDKTKVLIIIIITVLFDHSCIFTKFFTDPLQMFKGNVIIIIIINPSYSWVKWYLTINEGDIKVKHLLKEEEAY